MDFHLKKPLILLISLFAVQYAHSAEHCASGPVVVGPIIFAGNETHSSETTLSTIGVVQVSNGANIIFQASDGIALAEGFRVEFGGKFISRVSTISCSADLVINEILQNPFASNDLNGEWFEIYNPSGFTVDISNWTIQDNGIDSHVINNGGPLQIPAGGYLVLGKNENPLENGGVNIDYQYDNITLGNGTDELILLDDVLNEVDRVEWDGGVIFPDPSGASMLLSAPLLDNNIGANWCTAATPFGDGDRGTPGAANECLSLPLVINEIMQNPLLSPDTAGEWFEIYNPGNFPVDINSWTIQDNGSNSHIIDNGGPLQVPAGGYLVLGNNENLLENGGVDIDYQYSNITLGNSTDELVLLDDTLNEVDRVEWDNGATFPDPSGASMLLSAPSLDNNIGANWCTAVTPFGDGDRGTPGAANECLSLPLVINEIMQNPFLSPDSAGEWFEIYNPGNFPVDINNWTIQDNGSDSHLINNGVPLRVPAGGYLVLGNNENPLENGGVNIDYQYGNMLLGNATDEIILLDVILNEVDRVEWDNGATFPDFEGASMMLSDPTLDNNSGPNWCSAVLPYGTGDAGTPGVVNHDCSIAI